MEVALAYTVPHGPCVAQGMRVAARIGVRVGCCSEGLVAQQDELLSAFGLPGRLRRVSPEAVLAAIPRDKKSRDGHVGWVLPRTIGKAVVGQRVPDDVVADVIWEVLGSR
jgi:3-dehydroquinate synthase